MKFDRRPLACFILVIVLFPQVGLSLPSDEGAARTAFQEGVARFEKGEYERALVAFQNSYNIVPKPSVLFNIAMCQRALFDHAAALNTFERFKKSKHEAEDSFRSRRTRQALAELDRLVARIELTGSPDGAAVYVGEKKMGLTPLREPVVVNPGKIILVLRKDGYTPFVREMLLETGARVRLSVPMVEEGPPEPTPPAQDTRENGSPQPKDSVEIVEPVEPVTDSGVNPYAVSAVATGVGAIVASGLVGYFAYQRNWPDVDDAIDAIKAGDRDTYDEIVERAEGHETGIVVSSIVAGALGAASVVLFILYRKRDISSDEGEPEVTVRVRPNGLVVKF